MATQDEIKVGKLFRHKGGKLYRIDNSYRGDNTKPRWGMLIGPDGRCVYENRLSG